MNGEKSKVIRADLGFIGIPLSSGNNDVILSYHTPYLKAGMVMTILGVVIYIIWLFVLKHISSYVSKSK